MRYFSTTLGTNLKPADWRMKLVYALLWFIPRSNPDFEVHFSSIRRWYIEVDDSELPVREIGLDDNGTPITAGPWERNFGFWTDSGEPLPKDRLEEIDSAEFETVWQRFVRFRADTAQASHVA
jgi:hypothetical protein